MSMLTLIPTLGQKPCKILTDHLARLQKIFTNTIEVIEITLVQIVSPSL